MTRAQDPEPLMLMEGAPGSTLPVPTSEPQPPVDPTTLSPIEALRDAIDDGVAHAMSVLGARDYFLLIAKNKPDLFFKYVQLATAAQGGAPGAAKSRTYQVISPLAPSPLDDHPAP